MNETCFRWKSRWICAVLFILMAGAALSAQSDNLTMDPNTEVADSNEPQVDFSNGCLIKFIAFQKDMTIREGLRLLAALCKKNIVPSGAVEGPLTISRLYNVTFEQALDAVLGHGFKYEQDGDFVRVYTTEELKKIKEDPERMIHKVITLYYITAVEAVKLCEPVLSESAKIQSTSAAQKTISDASSSGSGSSGGGGLTSSGGGDDLALNDMIVIYDYPENIERAEAIIRSVDTRPKQVLIEATIMAARLTEEMKFGIDWNLLSGLPVTSSIIVSGDGYGTPIETSGFAAAPGSRGLTVGFSAGNARAVITALESVTDTTLLANPKILAVNKQEGIVYIGRKIGYEDTTTTTLTGGTTASVKFLETGTRLAFRPYIGDDGYIRMDIYPKDSDGLLKQNNIPDETSTELRTNVVVKDGQTVVIGGLFRDKIDTSKDQVPVLGNLPFVGVLFRGNTDTVRREEVIIVLTPHIIDASSDTDPEDRLDDIRVKREGAKDSLQVIDRAKLAEDAYARAARHYLEGNVEQALFNVKVALQMRPTYLEALRLRERIVAETDPEQFKRLDSIALSEIDEQEAQNWRRH